MTIFGLASALAGLRAARPQSDAWMAEVADAERRALRELTATPSADRRELDAKVQAIVAVALDGDHDDLWPDLLLSFARDHARLDKRRRVRHAAVSDAGEGAWPAIASAS